MAVAPAWSYNAAATEGGVTFELSVDDAALVREFVEGRLVELKKEINRTENIAFREELRKVQRALERLLDQFAQHIPAG